MKIRQQFLFIFIFALFLLGNAGHFMLPQVFTSYKARSYSSETKANLHNMYLGCQAFWADEGASTVCTVSMIANEEYGYIQSQDVKIYGSGTKNDFFAVAWNQRNNILHDIDSRGAINEQSEALKNILNKNPPEKIWIYEKVFPRHLVYYSIILILPIATMFLTFWAEGSSILRKKRKSPSLIHIGAIVGSVIGVIIGWVVIVYKDLYVVIFFLLMILIFIILTTWLILRIKRKSPSLIHIGISIGVVFGWLLIALITSGFGGSDYSYYVGFGKPFGIFLFIPVIYSFLRASSLIRWGKQIEAGKELPEYLENQNAIALKKSGKYLYGVIGVLLAVNITYGFMVEYYGIDYKNRSVKFSEEIESFIQADTSWLQRMHEVH